MVAPTIAGSLFGLFVSLTNVSVPLTGVNYDFKVQGFASHTTINQTYRNNETSDIECVYGFPINDQASVAGFTVTIGNRTLTSQFKKREEAYKEYSEALARNDGAYLLEQSDRSDDTFVLSVGRLPAGAECTVSISYVGTLESVNETRMRLVIPTSLFPRYNPTPQKPPSGVAPPEKYQSSVPYQATLTGQIDAIERIMSVTSPTHPINATILGPKEASVRFSAPQEPLDRDLFIEIQLDKNPESYVEVEMSSPGNYTAMYSFTPHFKLNSSAAVNTELIFVVDCSGSMYGEKIQDAKRAMQIFLRSIPEGSYFNFYLFGSSFQSLFPESQLYSANNFAKAKVYASTIDANLGGTEILQPLEKIFSSPSPPGFSRQVFVMTDGEVTNTDEVIALVRANAFNTRLFAFGLGQSPSRSLVNGIAAAGNGKAEFIKEGEGLENTVARNLNRALQPAVTDLTITWHGVQNVQQVPARIPQIFKGDRQLVYAFFQHDAVSPEPTYVELNIGGVKLKVPVDISPEVTEEQPFLVKLAAREQIKQLENSKLVQRTGSLQNRPNPQTDDQRKEQITDISLRYGVLSKYVSLIAVESRNAEGNKSNPMQLREVPVQLVQPSRPEQSVNNMYMSPQMMPMPAMISGSSGIRFGMAGVMGYSHRTLSKTGFGGPPGMAASFEAAPAVFESDSSDSDINDDSMDSAGAGRTPNMPAPTGCASVSLTTAKRLTCLLDLQQWNGAWNLTHDLEQLTNISRVEVSGALTRPAAALDDTVVGTVLVVTYIQEKYAAQADVWQAIVNKAIVFLGKQPDPPAVNAATTTLRKLILSK